MQTIAIEVEDNVIKNLKNLGYSLNDIKEEFKNYVYDFFDDGYPGISYEEACKRVEESVERYKTNPESFIQMDENFWDNMEKKLIQRYNERKNANT